MELCYLKLMIYLINHFVSESSCLLSRNGRYASNLIVIFSSPKFTFCHETSFNSLFMPSKISSSKIPIRNFRAFYSKFRMYKGQNWIQGSGSTFSPSIQLFSTRFQPHFRCFHGIWKNRETLHSFYWCFQEFSARHTASSLTSFSIVLT